MINQMWIHFFFFFILLMQWGLSFGTNFSSSANDHITLVMTNSSSLGISRFLGGGYDICSANPLNPQMDPGIVDRHHIFKLSVSSNNTCPHLAECQILTPKDITIQSQLFNNFDESQSSLLQLLDIFGEEIHDENLTSVFGILNPDLRLHLVSSIVARDIKIIVSEKTELSDRIVTDFSKLFIKALCELSIKYSRSVYTRFYKKFGTHVIVQMKLGSLSLNETSISRVKFNSTANLSGPIFRQLQTTFLDPKVIDFMKQSGEVNERRMISTDSDNTEIAQLGSRGEIPMVSAIREIPSLLTFRRLYDVDCGLADSDLPFKQRVATLKTNLERGLMDYLEDCRRNADQIFGKKLELENLAAISRRNSPADVSGSEYEEAGSWSILEAFMSINYENTFRVSVYKKDRTEDLDEQQFYYSPALIIDPSSAVSFFNNFTKRHEMIFSVLMWDETFEKFVQNKVSQKLKLEMPESIVRVLPIEEIRIDTKYQAKEYRIVNDWISYSSQPSTFQFRFVCMKRSDCDELAEQVKVNTREFVIDLTVFYRLQIQRILGDKDNAPGKIRREPMKVMRSAAEVTSKINVLGSSASISSILGYRSEVYRMKKELQGSIGTVNSTLTNSTLDLDKKVKQLDWLPNTKEILMHLVNRQNWSCNGTVLRVIGASVETNSAIAPNGTVCVGNTRNPSPSHNFLVYNKVGSQLYFMGTQSLRKGFIDFTSYVTWSVPAQQYCTDVGGCDKLPNHLRSLINGGYGGRCSKSSVSGTMYLACHNNADALVDDDGAITVLTEDTATLWY